MLLGNTVGSDGVKKLNNDELSTLCEEIRAKIVETVSYNGGHLASSLGAVELTVAAYKCFDFPNDTIIFDVGHQCYAHKLLSGRYDRFGTLRKMDGISGFMRPDESLYDKVVSGHSSTSVSSAYGIAKANELQGRSSYTVAVIGDGALTGGMSYEAILNTHKRDKNLILILNDNKMSISKSRGALSHHLLKIRTHKEYFKFKSGVERFLEKIPFIGKHLRNFVFNIKVLLKNAFYDSNIFESLGLYYMGPVDGNDLNSLIEIFGIAKELNRPVIIHLKTLKGKGYRPAEENPDRFHGVSGFDVETGEIAPAKRNFSSVFGDTLISLAENDDKICAVTAAMQSGTGLDGFAERFKSRFFDVGIAEQHAVTFSCGLAVGGMKPVFAVYSTFLQRGYDQVLHDAAISKVPLTLCVDRAGFVGDDGETHQGIFDVAFLSSIPGVTIYSPASFDELKNTLKKRFDSLSGVAAIRYPRGGEPEFILSPRTENEEYSVFSNGKTAVVTYGIETFEAVKALDELTDTEVIKLNKLNPISEDTVKYLLQHDKLFFFEEGILSGGVGERIGSFLMENGYKGTYSVTAVTGFVRQAKVNEQRKMFGLNADSIIKKVRG